MDCSIPGLPVHHQLPEFTQTNTHVPSGKLYFILYTTDYFESPDTESCITHTHECTVVPCLSSGISPLIIDVHLFPPTPHRHSPHCLIYIYMGIYMSAQSVHSLCHVRLFATPWIAARQASLSITSSQSSLRFTSIESVMPSSHLILGGPLLLLTPIPPSIRVFQWVNSSHEVAKVMEFQL